MWIKFGQCFINGAYDALSRLCFTIPQNFRKNIILYKSICVLGWVYVFVTLYQLPQATDTQVSYTCWKLWNLSVTWVDWFFNLNTPSLWVGQKRTQNFPFSQGMNTFFSYFPHALALFIMPCWSPIFEKLTLCGREFCKILCVVSSWCVWFLCGR